MCTTTASQAAWADPPIACTLTSEEYRNRTRALSALARRALRSRRPIDGGERLTFGAADGIESELRAAVAAEAACCPFLTMALERRDGELVLDVTGPADAAQIITELFA